MKRLNYRHLEAFWTVARTGAFGAAARELGVSQPTLSAQVAALEDACGKRLLSRGAWGARPTPEGESVLRHCRRIFAAGEQLLADVALGLEASPRTLRVGAHAAVPRVAVMRVLEAARAADPGLRLSVSGGTPAGLRERLESRDLDLAISALDLGPHLGRDFRTRTVGALPLVFAAAPSVAARLGPFPACLDGAPLLLRGDDSPVTARVERLLSARGLAPRREARADDAGLLRAMTLAGHGIAALEYPAAREDLAAGRLVRLNKGPSGLRAPVWLAAPRADDERPGLERPLAALWGRFALGRDLVAEPPRA